MSYKFNPHKHVKIWLTRDKNCFMHFENQVRLLEMREKNPDDQISLIYDSELLSAEQHSELKKFTSQNNIIAIDANDFSPSNDTERELYEYYKDEIRNLDRGGNLGVASDILRWLRISYENGSYTDLDVPLKTKHAPAEISLDVPIALNIGSLNLWGKKDMLLVLNEVVIVADEKDARDKILAVQKGILAKLKCFSSDYIHAIEAAFQQESRISSHLLSQMRNRAEYQYIKMAAEVNDGYKLSSRLLRAHFVDVTSSREKFLSFHRKNSNETEAEIIKRLKKEVSQQRTIVKKTFFRSESKDQKALLQMDDDAFLNAMMQRERTLFLKSIVVCTTGPMEVGRSFFNNYVMDRGDIDKTVRPYDFSNYCLNHVFLSRNVLPLHVGMIGMLRYLGSATGKRNDSSWLPDGIREIDRRQVGLQAKRDELVKTLPASLNKIKKEALVHIEKLEKEDKGFFAFFFRKRRHAKIKALNAVVKCFEDNNVYNIDEFKKQFTQAIKPHKSRVYAGFFSSRTKTIIKRLKSLSHAAITLRVVDNNRMVNCESEVSPSSSLVPTLRQLGPPTDNSQVDRGSKPPQEPKIGERAYDPAAALYNRP